MDQLITNDVLSSLPHEKPTLVMFLNSHYLQMTFNWLCSTAQMRGTSRENAPNFSSSSWRCSFAFANGHAGSNCRSANTPSLASHSAIEFECSLLGWAFQLWRWPLPAFLFAKGQLSSHFGATWQTILDDSTGTENPFQIKPNKTSNLGHSLAVEFTGT